MRPAATDASADEVPPHAEEYAIASSKSRLPAQ